MDRTFNQLNLQPTDKYRRYTIKENNGRNSAPKNGRNEQSTNRKIEDLSPPETLFQDQTRRINRKRIRLEITGLEAPMIVKELNKNELFIGREEQCDITIPSLTVSGQHARIYCIDNAYYIEDLASSNGTKVNGKGIIKTKLTNNDYIEIFNVTIRFCEK